MRARDLAEGAVKATFVPSDPPRYGSVGLWPVEHVPGADGLAIRPIDRFTEVEGSLTLETVDMAMMPLVDFAALSVELGGDDHPSTSPSVLALAAAARHGLHLVARASVAPAGM